MNYLQNRLHRYTFLLLPLLLALVSSSQISAKETEHPERPSMRSADADHLPGTLVLKLRRPSLTPVTSLSFGIGRLDEELQQLSITERTSLFPRAAGSNNHLTFISWIAPQSDQEYGFDRIFIVRYAAAADVYEAIDLLMKTGDLEYAEPYYIFQLFYQPDDQRYSQQYSLQLINIEQAWDISKGDPSVTIAVCDAGVDWNHPDLAGNIRVNQGESGTDGSGKDKRSNGIDDDGNGYVDDWHGWDFIGNTTTIAAIQNGQWRPDNDPAPRQVAVADYRGYHGTWVSGCAAARTDNGLGIAAPGFNSTILPLKCSADSLVTGSVIAGYQGITYAADMGARVINCSFGGAVNPAFVQGLQATVDYAHSRGALVVAASGNEATHNDRTPIFPSSLNHVLSVGATSSADAPASFSGYGVSVDVWGPGVSVLTTDLNNNYTSSNVSGTSFASPLLSGVAALLFALHPDWDPDQVAMQLRVTGDVINGGGPLRYRRVNAGRALSVNRELTIEGPAGSGPVMPGVGLLSWSLDSELEDTITSPEMSIPVTIDLRNYLAPTEDLRIEAYNNGELTCDAVNVGEIGTMEDLSVTLNVRLDPASDILYSEGDLQLILRLVDGTFENFVTLTLPVSLPGWEKQLDVLALNSTYQYYGSSIHAPSTTVAWTVSNVVLSSAVQIGMYARNAFGTQWSTPTQLQVNGTTSQTPLFCVAGLDRIRAWAGSGSGVANGLAVVLRTVDGGSTWQQSDVSAFTPFVNAVYFWDKDNGIVLGDPQNGKWGIGRSTNGGVSWSPLASPLSVLSSSEAGWNNSYAVVGDHVWFGSNAGRIWRSTDRGMTWQYGVTPSINSFGMAFSDETNGMAVFRPLQSGSGTYDIAMTTDGGATWRSIPLPYPGVAPQGITAVPGGRFMVGTARGVFETSDGGATWKQMAMPIMQFDDIILSAAFDEETGTLGAYGTNAFSQLIAYHETAPVDPSGGVAVENRVSEMATIRAFRFYRSGNGQIDLQLPAPGRVAMELYNVEGGLAGRLLDRDLSRGLHSLSFDVPDDLRSGQYFLRIITPSGTLVRQIEVVR